MFFLFEAQRLTVPKIFLEESLMTLSQNSEKLHLLYVTWKSTGRPQKQQLPLVLIFHSFKVTKFIRAPASKTAINTLEHSTAGRW